MNSKNGGKHISSRLRRSVVSLITFVTGLTYVRKDAVRSGENCFQMNIILMMMNFDLCPEHKMTVFVQDGRLRGREGMSAIERLIYFRASVAFAHTRKT